MRTIDPDIWSRVKGKPKKDRRRIFRTPSATALERRLRNSFRDAVRDWWTHCSIAGVKCIRGTLPKRDRYFSILFIVVLTILGVVLMASSWSQYRRWPPLVVSLVRSQHPADPARRAPFPAVALCSSSVVSERALGEYANYLYSLDQNGTYPLSAVRRNLLAFGALQTWDNPPTDVGFMDHLARVAHETNVTSIVLRLTPRCTSFLKRCAWRAARVPCERLFALRATPHGFCCVFNSQYQEEDQRNAPHQLSFAGQDFGLSLVVRENDSDTAFVRGPGEGAEVLLFDGSEYPSLVGGSARLYRTQANTSTFFKVRSRSEHAAPSLRHYSEEWRGCRIRHPGSREMARRSQGWCQLACRRRAARALCGCVPHLLLPALTDTVCAPDHLACLNKHKEKFRNYYPGESAHESLREESSDSLVCGSCLPDCARLSYSAALSHVDYQYTHKLFLNVFLEGLTLLNTTTIRIFYALEDHKLYLVETNLRLYEVAAYLGSQWSCVLAVSVASVAELLYHVTIRWGHHYIRRLRLDRRKTWRHLFGNSLRENHLFREEETICRLT